MCRARQSHFTNTIVPVRSEQSVLKLWAGLWGIRIVGMKVKNLNFSRYGVPAGRPKCCLNCGVGFCTMASDQETMAAGASNFLQVTQIIHRRIITNVNPLRPHEHTVLHL